MGKKPIVSVTYENERISTKKQLTLLEMCVTSRSPVWSTGRFMAVLWVKPLYREKTVYIKTHFIFVGYGNDRFFPIQILIF